MKIASLCFAAALSLAVAPSARAVDGVTLITQANALTPLPGCTNGGSTLVTICNPGSYRLGGDLIAGSFQSGIVITADNVTLDLNGFTIFGPSGSGVGVSSSKNQISVLNGRVVQFFNGVELDGIGITVEHVTSTSATEDGIRIAQGVVRYCTVLNSGTYGIIVISTSATIASNVSHNQTVGGQVGIINFAAGTVSMTHNVVQGASQNGIYYALANGLYAMNTFANNAADVGGGGTSLGNNFCSNGSLC